MARLIRTVLSSPSRYSNDISQCTRYIAPTPQATAISNWLVSDSSAELAAIPAKPNPDHRIFKATTMAAIGSHGSQPVSSASPKPQTAPKLVQQSVNTCFPFA
jgi:hypothetical protein